MAKSDPPRLSRSARNARVPWIPLAQPDEIRAHVQTRLRLMAGLIFWVCLVLFGFVLALYELYPDTRPKGADLVHRFAFVGLAALGAIWGIAMRRPLPIQVLYRIDAVIVLCIGGVFGLSAYVNSEQRAAVWAAFIWHTFTIFSRALIVPSTGRRTAVIGAVSYIPFIAAGFGMAIYKDPHQLEVPPRPFVIGVWLFSGMATLLATTGSRLIYGLRADLRQARQLGQYTLHGLIAKGPMSAVYHARHALLRRPTAVKLLPPEKHGADDLARFEREVQHMSQLTHPNTVAIYDYGRSPDGVFYYAMEYVDGVDLEVLVHLDGPLPATRVVPIVRQICGALEEAHSRGLTHRDVKPANVILCRRGNLPDVVKVLDFGLVVEVARDGSDSEGGARPGVLGTPAYLAPEVITSPEHVGPKSDLYGVGAVAYFLLTGERVFTGTSVAQLCLAHVHETPIPPRQRTDRPISAELEALVLACLAKDPAQRPESARALRVALDAVPEAAAWDEDAALAWWNAFEERKKPAASGGTAGPRTITVDLMARATTSGEVT